MNVFYPFSAKLTIVLFVATLLISGCSSSGDSGNNGAAVNTENTGNGDGTSTDNANTAQNEDNTAAVESNTPSAGSDSLDKNTTRINFEVTVPVYVSDELQVLIGWGDKELSAAWNRDEFWTASDDLPSDTDINVNVRFSDGNGAITLGSVARVIRTGTNASELIEITADDFDTESWDNDGDGVSNLDELRIGTDPLADVPLEPVQIRLELLSDKTYRISWDPSAGAQFYRVLENPDGVSGYSVISDDLNASTQRFDHRVALFNRTSARYLVQACNASECVDSTEQAVSGSLWNAIGYVKASNAENFDNFGSAVSLSADGSTLAVAAYAEDSASPGINGNQNDNSALSSGAVYVFVHNNGGWQQQAYLKASNADKDDLFGFSMNISLSATGDTLVVGAPAEQSSATGINGDQNNNSAARSGAAYVFQRINASWEQQAYIKASNTGEIDRFGASVSLSGNGTLLAVGATTEDGAATGINGNDANDAAPDAGAVYLFELSNGSWHQIAYVKASNAQAWKEFGGSVSLSADGSTLAVGSAREDSSATGVDGNQNNDDLPDAGAVYVFTQENGEWQQQAYVKASNPAVGDAFGRVVSLSANGNTLAVGANFENGGSSGVNGNQLNRSATSAGAVYIFERSNGSWQQQAYIKASNPNRDDRFGGAISLSADGNGLAVGATYEQSLATGINGNQSDNSALYAGAVYWFLRTNDNWQQRAYLKASNADPRDYFGASVSLSADGSTLAVGATRESGAATGIQGNQSDDAAPSAGAVYLY